MIDYSKKSDFEISAYVALELNCRAGQMIYLGDDENIYSLNYDDIDSPYSDGEPVEVTFDPCNSWCDAGPIIQKHRIALMPDSSSCGKYYWWDVQSECQKHGLQHQNNPLRAAMIIFLMASADGKQ